MKSLASDFLLFSFIASVIAMLITGCATTHPKATDPFKLAQRHVKHQHLLIGSLKEILQVDAKKECVYLDPTDCQTLIKDQSDLMTMMHEASIPYGELTGCPPCESAGSPQAENRTAGESIATDPTINP